jgi:opacity protein-like surface antigen
MQSDTQTRRPLAPEADRSDPWQRGRGRSGRQVALLLVVGTAPALAANPSGLYLGGGFGQFDLHINNLDDVGQAVSSIAHSHDDAWQAFLGYRLNPYVGVEAAYVDLGKPGEQFTANGYQGHYHVHLDGFEPAIIGTLPLGPLELFAKAGYYYYDLRLTANDNTFEGISVTSSHTRESFLYGGGIGVTIADHLNLRAEYDQINLTNYQSSEALWLLAAWRI